ncbi:acyltransferase family protein [Sphaerisporangium corydalis]|uniref:Acyltransferase family protein n=1 Tax=Sphaerisporangium corydalis TaxID=1441875 RepID=A0ABV9EAQ4_9ACTN|nr:acyltransferase family protein [Sphaerisporangium corydalis]
MSDTRSSFQVPSPRTDGVSTDADEVGAPGTRGPAPIDPGQDAETGDGGPEHPAGDATEHPAGDATEDPAEDAPTARWPVPDYAAPPTGAWDRHRPPTGGRSREPLWPAPETAEGTRPPAEGDAGAEAPAGRPRQAGRSPYALRPARTAEPAPGPGEDDDPETFTFDRPAWGGPPPAEAPHEHDAPVSDGFSFWERRPVADDPSPAAAAPVLAGRARVQEAPAGDSAPREAVESPAPARAKRAREPYLDNVKFVLIALVVTGHSLVPTLGTHSSRSLYVFIYVFHMPLFVLISGYLSRNFWNSNAKTNKLVDTFLVPYVIVEVGYAVLRTALGHKWSLTIIDPSWLNWYLLALLLWRLSTPVWRRMRYPLPIAVGVYLMAGLSDLPGDFSMDRFFGLMPFFVLGLWLQPRHFEMLNRRWVKILAGVVLAGAAGVALLISKRLPLSPLYFKESYAELHMSWWVGMGVRAALLVAALTVSAAILALVPRRNTWFTDLGTRTLYCYLLHGVPVLIAKDMGWLGFRWLHGPLGVMAIMSSCFALAIVLCLPETRKLFKWLLEPRLVWLYRRPSS